MPMPGLGGGLCGAALLAAQPFWLRGCAVEAMEAWWGCGWRRGGGADGGVVRCGWRRGEVRMEAWERGGGRTE